MPNIRDFSAPEGLGLQPSSVGTEAAASAGRRVGAFYNQAGQALADTGQRVGSAVKDAGDAAVQYMEHREISLGAANLAQLQQNQVDAWNAAAKGADPNDPTVAAKFRETTMEPALDKFSQSFMTEGAQKWAESRVDRFRQHMFEKTSADMSSLAADAVHMNVVKTMNATGNMVYNDPSSLDFARDTLRSSVASMADSSPNLSPEAAAKVKTDLTVQGETHLVRGAIMGAIAKGGDWKRIADDPKNAPFVNEAEIETFVRAQKAQERTDLLRQKQIETYQRQQDDLSVHVAGNKILSDSVTIDPTTGRPSIKPGYFEQSLDLARKYPNAPNAATTAKTMIDWGEHQQATKRELVISDPGTMKNLDDRLFSPTNPTTRIDLMRAQIAGKLSDHDFNSRERLVTELEQRPLKGPIWQDTMKAVESELVLNVPGIPGKDNVGLANYSKFIQSFVPDYLAKERSGTLPPNALDVKDPQSMISKAMAPFQRTQANRMQDYVAAAGGLKIGGEVPEKTPDGSADRSTGVTPTRVRQNGHTYEKQPDGKYKAID